jgi:hypothetical protein
VEKANFGKDKKKLNWKNFGIKKIEGEKNGIQEKKFVWLVRSKRCNEW